MEENSNIFLVTDTDSGQYFLECEKIDQKVDSIFLDLRLESGSDIAGYVNCDIFAIDEGNASYYHIPSDGSKYVVVPGVPKSRWFRTQFYGKLKGIKIQFDEEQMQVGSRLILDCVILNRPKDMHFSLWRVLGMELLLALMVVFQKGSPYYNYIYVEQKKVYKVGTSMVLFLQVISLVFILNIVQPYTQKRLTVGGSHEQYQNLAVAMTKGQVFLDEKVPDWLIAMENPFDTGERDRLAKETGEPYLWDNVYYQGHYYVYFGIVPVVLFYLPYYLICHEALPNVIPILFCWSVICVAFARLFGIILKKWFPNFPYILYLLIMAVFPFCIGSIAVVHRPTIYEVPISMGMMFAVLGLDLWLESVQNGEIVSIPKMAAGSFCVALVAGCRPTIFVVFLFSFIIFGEFVHKKKGEILTYRKAIAAFCLPFIVVAVGLMYYNWIRFGSVFDFGANYNLTNNDMTKRGFHVGRIGLGLFEFLWKPLTLSVRFPFVKIQNVESSYMGKMICSSNIGGIFALCPLFLVCVTIVLCRKRFKQYRQPYRLAALAAVLAVLIIALTVNMAGIYPRYKADFGFLIGIASVLAVCMTDACLSASSRSVEVLHWYYVLLFWMCVASIFLNVLSIFATVEYSFALYNPNRFYSMKYLFEFWH